MESEREKVIIEIILDKLFGALDDRVKGDGRRYIVFNGIDLDNNEMTYLLEKLDPLRFKAYQETILSQYKEGE